jgi:hypothetical protein
MVNSSPCLVLIILLRLLLPAPADWLFEKTVQPIGVRNAQGMAYDSKRGRIVLFGGADATKVCGDTWEWDGKRWELMSVVGPGPRTFPAMAYDSLRQRVVLFGGNRVLFGRTPEENQFLGDTWEWDGKRWLQIDVNGPPPRAEAAVAFDSKRGRIVLFGGHNRNEQGRNRLGDTWEWDGTRWTRLMVTGPSPRNGAAQVYDSVRGRIILFGGATPEGVSGETWEWDGKHWVENRSATTEGRFNCVMAFDRRRRKVIRFGGRYGGKPVGDTWQYDGKTWKQIRSTGPAARNHAAMVYSSESRSIILFGGHDLGTHQETNVFGDTWEWNGSDWRIKGAGHVEKRVDYLH